MPTLADLLAKGYFPKELPTPFTTATYAAAFGAALPAALVSARYETDLCKHALARPAMLNRTAGIPHPLHFFRLAKTTADNWTKMDTVIRASQLTLTAPTDDPRGVRALVPATTREETDERAHHRASARYVVFADVSQWYPSVYTHSIAWAAHGKAAAKAARTSTSLFGNALDRNVRHAQGNQTVGIPIGPDTSFAIGEMVLSACDDELRQTGTRLRGFRKYDDYELYAGTYSEASRLVARLQAALGTFQLTLNPHKVRVVGLPLEFEVAWKSDLKRHTVRFTEKSQRSDIVLLFDAAFRHTRAFPQDSVIAYALGRFIDKNYQEGQRVAPANWRLFQQLMLQSVQAEPGLLPKVAHILNWEAVRGRSFEKALLVEALSALVVDAAEKGHASEVAWALWTAISMNVRLRAAAARAASAMHDDVVALVALHAQSKGLLPRGLNTDLWKSWMTSDQLRGEHWLVAFEAFEHGWLPSASGADYIAADALASFLRAGAVRFYDEAASLPPPPRRIASPVVASVVGTGATSPTGPSRRIFVTGYG